MEMHCCSRASTEPLFIHRVRYRCTHVYSLIVSDLPPCSLARALFRLFQCHCGKQVLSGCGRSNAISTRCVHATGAGKPIPCLCRPSQPGTNLAARAKPNEKQRHDGGYARHSPGQRHRARASRLARQHRDGPTGFREFVPHVRSCGKSEHGRKRCRSSVGAPGRALRAISWLGEVAIHQDGDSRGNGAASPPHGHWDTDPTPTAGAFTGPLTAPSRSYHAPVTGLLRSAGSAWTSLPSRFSASAAGARSNGAVSCLAPSFSPCTPPASDLVTSCLSITCRLKTPSDSGAPSKPRLPGFATIVPKPRPLTGRNKRSIRGIRRRPHCRPCWTPCQSPAT